MKCAKMIAASAIAAAAMLAFAGSASATTITSPTNSLYTNTIHAVSEGKITIHGPAKVECESTIQGSIESHGTSVTAAGNLTHLTFTNCTPQITVTTLKAGELIWHTDIENVIDSNGTITSSGAEIKIQFHELGGITCIYTTAGTHLGTLTGSHTTGGNAILHVEKTIIPRTGGTGGIFCGATAELTGTYRVTTPSALYVD